VAKRNGLERFGLQPTDLSKEDDEALLRHPLPRERLTEHDRLQDEATYQRAIESGARPQDQKYNGQMPNVEAFEAVPWQARTEMERNLGKYTPSHLHVFTDDERDPAHYPKAAVDRHGNFLRFCWACGRPCRHDGVSGKGHKGTGKPCPVCGFRRRRATTPGQLAAVRRNTQGANNPALNGHAQALAAERRELAALEGIGPRGGLRQGVTMTDLMRERTLEVGDVVMRPYFEALQLAPKEDWSPSTKLSFYIDQTVVAEKLLNRSEGLPVARTRHVTKDDEDVLRDDELSPSTLVSLVAAMATGADVDKLLGPVEDAEFEELPPAA